MLMPGEFATCRLTFVRDMPILKGQTFTIREQKATIGTGKITKLLKSIPVDKRKMSKVKITDLHESQSS